MNTDFAVSDYFLTLNAVGVINFGTVHGPLQGAATIYGNAENVTQLVDEIEELLGAEILAQFENLQSAINALKASDGKSRRQAMENVVVELSRYIGHVGNTGSAITAIILVARSMGMV